MIPQAPPTPPTTEPLSAPPSSVTEPFVGLHPFDRKQSAIFFGRARDARLIADKIFAARLTLFYGPSGVGKSSVLHTLVIPRLEQEHARALYFDGWSGQDPLAALKAQLADAASQLGVPAPGAGSPTLADLVRLINDAAPEDRTLVLILDQFEEFLTHHTQGIEPLRGELAELVRTKELDVRIVLSLRQEQLAALEPFRRDLVNLFQYTALLEPLPEKGVRDAIEGPVQVFGGQCEPALVEALLTDLRASSLPGAQATVELPMLQLVCQQLWRAVVGKTGAAPAGGKLRLTYALYKQLGGASKILARYMREQMPRRYRQRVATARLMLSLAPPSGFKISFSAADLAAITRIKEPRIRPELERLRDCLILRERDFQGGRRFELIHDAYIKVIGPWRDQVLRGLRILRLCGVLGAGLAVALLVAGLTYRSWHHERQREALAKKHEEQRVLDEKQRADRENTTELLDQLSKREPAARAAQAGPIFDRVAGYMLLRQGTDLHLDKLATLLKTNAALIPAEYGIDTTGPDAIGPPAGFVPLPVLRYSSRRALNEDHFAQVWRRMAARFAQSLGIPAPSYIRAVEDPTFPKTMLRLTGPGMTPFDLDLPVFEDQVYLSAKALPLPALNFMNQFKSEFTPVTEVTLDGPWFLVPRWSLPVWHSMGQQAMDGSGYVALLLAKRLKESPERLLTKDAAELLLARLGSQYPVTLAEARAARGEHLYQDLVALVQKGRSLESLPVLLDAFAAYPGLSSVALASREGLLCDTLANVESSALHGPWKSPPTPAAAPAGADEKPGTPSKKAPAHGSSAPRWPPRIPGHEPPAALRESAGALPAVPVLIRVYLGRALLARWTTGRGNLTTPMLRGRLLQLQEDVFRRTGVLLPNISFCLEAGLAATAFRIEVLGQSRTHPDAQPIVPAEGKAEEQLLGELSRRTAAMLACWLTAEQTRKVRDSLPSGIRQYLSQHYSLTDLKTLRRAVVSSAPHKSAAPSGAASERTLRYETWLLRSLVFWTQVEGPLAQGPLVRRLQETQRARLRPSVAAGVDAVIQDVTLGIQELLADRVEPAEAQFKRALAADRPAAIRAFVSAYASQLVAETRSRVMADCTQPLLVNLDLSSRVNLMDLLDSRHAGLNDREQRKLELCLLFAVPAEMTTKRNQLRAALLSRDGDPDKWSAMEAGALAAAIIRAFDPLTDPPSLADQGGKFLTSALARLDQNNKAELQAGFDYAGAQEFACRQEGPTAWCYELVASLAAQSKGWVVALDAYILSGSEQKDHLSAAVALARRAEQELGAGHLPAKARAFYLSLCRLARAHALLQLVRLGDAQQGHLQEAESLLRGPFTAEHAQEAALYLTFLLGTETEGRRSEAEQVLDGALKKWPKEPSLRMERIWLYLLAGNVAAAEEMGRRMAEDLDDVYTPLHAAALSEQLFATAMALLLPQIAHVDPTRSSRAELIARRFLQTGNANVPYIAMMLYTSMAAETKQEAHSVIEERWTNADRHLNPTRWQSRLRAGDQGAWLELLIDYYHNGKLDAPEVFEPLDSEAAFARSALSRVRISRLSMRCEAFFYRALLARTQQNQEQWKRSLEEVLSAGQRDYYEYRMANFLLSQTSR